MIPRVELELQLMELFLLHLDTIVVWVHQVGIFLKHIFKIYMAIYMVIYLEVPQVVLVMPQQQLNYKLQEKFEDKILMEQGMLAVL